MTLNTSKVLLRKLSPDDIEDYFDVINDPEIHKTTEPYKNFSPYTKQELLTWLKGLSDKKDRADFAIIRKDTNQFIGEVVLNELAKSTANIRIAIKSNFHGKGFGHDAMKLAIQYGFEELKLQQITLSVFDINPRGLALYKKLGFVETSRGENEGFDETFIVLRSNPIKVIGN